MTDQDRREEGAEKTLPGVAAYSVAQTYTQQDPAKGEATVQAANHMQDVVSEEVQAEQSSQTENPAGAPSEDSEETQPDTAEPVSQVEASVEAQPEVAPVAPEAPEPVAQAEAQPEGAKAAVVETQPEAPEPVAQAEAPVAEQAEGGEAEQLAPSGASFTPVEDDADGVRPRRLKDLEIGQELEGRVTSIALYGVFVDIGVGRDGLVHISEMSDTRIDSPSDVVQIGDTVKVRVKGLDVEARRISLTMRSQQERRRAKRPDVDRDALANLKVGDTVEGVITGMAPFGAFADIGVGKDGLIHISELSEGRVEKPEDAVQVGERYIFKLLEVDPEGTRISLSLRRAMRAQKMQQLEPGQILEGTVSGLAQFGAFVDIGVGRDGLVHISELSEGRVGKVEDVVKVGDQVKVRVLEVNPQSKRISLTMRLEDRPAEEAAPSATETSERRRDEGGTRSTRSVEPEPEPAAEAQADDDETDAEFSGNATLEDLLTKFGGSKRKDRRRSKDREDEEDEEDRLARRQREAIRRTLQQVSNDD